MSNCFSEDEQLILPLDYPSEFSNLETPSELDNNTSPQPDEQPYICMLSQPESVHYNQQAALQIILEKYFSWP